MDNRILPGYMVRHFKGGIYKVMYFAKDSETKEDVVVYKNVNDSEKIWVRPLEQFMSKVDRIKYPECKQLYRFEVVRY